jgi:hypothetical protein
MQAMRLQEELKFYGSEMTDDKFNTLLSQVHEVLAPGLSEEQLLYQPTLALRLCEVMRLRAGAGLPDEMILRRLQNIRKMRRKSAEK